MSANATKALLHPIHRDIEAHPAWYGRISGLAGDKMLRNRNIPFLYLLRAGENEEDYYLSFLLPNLAIRHHPFKIIITKEGWCFDDGVSRGPYTIPSIANVLHLMMECQKENCVPLNKLK